MKVLLLTLLFLLCCTQVHTLRCFTCNGENDNICKTETDCDAGQLYCKKVQVQGEIISRTCAALCSNMGDTTCCQTDLC